MERYICLHGHFYQPPRENPWLEAIELQDSAYPYHDWNERITAECYAPNGASRMLDSQGRIEQIVNNYAKISFNMGPTLLAWMEAEAPRAYQAVLEADRQSQARFSGHGSALAQVYNHMIMPLANQRDKYTQVKWGIADFEHRFGRSPEGMWLAETAVDVETLEALAAEGIAFTILAPYQAARVRAIGASEWHDVAGGLVDPTMAYRMKLPSGRSITLLFYDGPISRAVAFEGLLNRGEYLANRLVSAFSSQRDHPQLVHIATDGETYGHHHHNGDMALAYALHYIETNELARLTNYGEYLAKHPPTHEVEIIDDTSWSCAHGIERWRGNCGCNSGGHPGWTQEWRAPLRQALDWLRDSITPHFEAEGRRLFHNPWAARDDFISVILDRSPEHVARLLAKHAGRSLSDEETVIALKLLELQRHAQLMYTSCGWFFDELSGIETVQVIQYAGRVLQLAREVLGIELETQFLDRLKRAKSNIRAHADGRRIYQKFVQPAVVDHKTVAAHYALSSLFEEYAENTLIYCYTVNALERQHFEQERPRLVIGRVQLTSTITYESSLLSFWALHVGDHNISAGVQYGHNPDIYQTMVRGAADALSRGDFAALLLLLDSYFGGSTYSLHTLFRDERRKILDVILSTRLAEDEAAYRRLYENDAALMRFVSDLGTPLPKAFHTAAEFIVNMDLRSALTTEVLDLDRINALLEEASTWQVELDTAVLAFTIRRTIERLIAPLQLHPGDLSRIKLLDAVVGVARDLPFEVDLWEAQNTFYEIIQATLGAFRDRASEGDDHAVQWLTWMESLGEKLHVRVSDAAPAVVTPAQSISAITADILAQTVIPGTTYRLQFNASFTFRDATALIPYLHELGVTTCYASPISRPRAGSMHGYDITDHTALNPALGPAEDFDAFAAALRAADMGLILDIVPNHMGIGDPTNQWWMDVLENGPASIYASYFDIDWHPVKPELENKVLLPILESQYGKALESGRLRVAYDDGGFIINHYEMQLPVAPKTYTHLLMYQLDRLTEELGEEHEDLLELHSILTALDNLPPQVDLDEEQTAVRNREKVIIRRRIATLYQANEHVRAHINRAVEAFNGVEGAPHSYDLLDELIAAQAYRPAFWRVAYEIINYRRFFDINELAALRVELPAVFQVTHELLLDLLVTGKATGVRIDHPDGLWNPAQYFRQLQRSFVFQQIQARLDGNGRNGDVEADLAQWFEDQSAAAEPFRPLYVVAEKILSEAEPLPREWAVHGTTGYDFLNSVNSLFVDGSQRKIFDRIYSTFIGQQIDLDNLINSSKKMIMLVSLASEINALSHQLERIAEKNRWYRDFTLNGLTFAIREVIACLPIYRTYITDTSESISHQDEHYIEAAVAEAKKRNPRTVSSIFDFIRDTLLLRNIHDFGPEDRSSLTDFAMKFQQVTGPVMAKGVEDTAFYIYNRLVSLNEVGGDPRQFGTSVAVFHEQNEERQRHWPHSLLTTSTHDTKRGEDVRARINVLSEVPDEWRAALRRWSRMNASKKLMVDGQPAPSRNDEYLLYQTLLGAWPAEPLLERATFAEFRQRIEAYMQKATNEAKVHTSWVNPNEGYNAAITHFVETLLPDGEDDPFLMDLMPFQRRVAYFGQFNSLAQVVLKLTAPGVPDLYQGTELWDLSLVDPDNRRPVDYQQRRSMLDTLKLRLERTGSERLPLARELLAASHDGRVKLLVTYLTIVTRRSHSALFTFGSYRPLEARGEKQEHVFAFARELEDEAVLVIVPRLVVGLTGGIEQPPHGEAVWQDTWLALPPETKGRRYRNPFTGEILTVADQDYNGGLAMAAILNEFPVAILERMPE